MTTRLPYPVLSDVAHDSQANFEAIDGHLDGLGSSAGSQSAELADHAAKLSQLDGVRTTLVTGTGAPTSTPAQTTFYFRKDTPSVVGQRIYVFDPVAVVWNPLV